MVFLCDDFVRATAGSTPAAASSSAATADATTRWPRACSASFSPIATRGGCTGNTATVRGAAPRNGTGSTRPNVHAAATRPNTANQQPRAPIAQRPAPPPMRAARCRTMWRGNFSSRCAVCHTKAAITTDACFRSAATAWSHTSMFEWCVRVL